MLLLLTQLLTTLLQELLKYAENAWEMKLTSDAYMYSICLRNEHGAY